VLAGEIFIVFGSIPEGGRGVLLEFVGINTSSERFVKKIPPSVPAGALSLEFDCLPAAFGSR
jgi:hypothetical protein